MSDLTNEQNNEFTTSNANGGDPQTPYIIATTANVNRNANGPEVIENLDYGLNDSLTDQNKEFNINEATKEFNIVECTDNPEYESFDAVALAETVSDNQNTEK